VDFPSAYRLFIYYFQLFFFIGKQSLSKKWNGGTTVAGTLIIANMVGIKIFATGGIGNWEGSDFKNK
jgi:Indigoidine synthase A like protein